MRGGDLCCLICRFLSKGNCVHKYNTYSCEVTNETADGYSSAPCYPFQFLRNESMFNVNRSANPPPVSAQPQETPQASSAAPPPPYSERPNPATDHPSHFAPSSQRIGDMPARPRTLLSHVPNILVPVLNTTAGLVAVAACEKLGLSVLQKAGVLAAVGMTLYKMSTNRINEMEEDEIRQMVAAEAERSLTS